MSELGGFLASYLSTEGKDDNVETIIARWEAWKRGLFLNSEIDCPFSETECNYLNSAILDGIYAVSKECIAWNEKAFVWLCENGYYETTVWMYETFSGLQARYRTDLPFRVACWKGHLKIAQWLHSHFPDINPLSRDERMSALASASLEGHLPVIEWIDQTFGLRNSGELDESFKVACANGYLTVARWIHARFPLVQPTAENLIFRTVCVNGHLEMAKWLMSTFPRDRLVLYYVDLLEQVCERGHLEILKWLIDTVGLCTDVDYFRIACEHNHLKMAKWVYEKWPKIRCGDVTYEFEHACKKWRLELAQWLYSITVIDSKDLERIWKELCPSRELLDWLAHEINTKK